MNPGACGTIGAPMTELNTKNCAVKVIADSMNPDGQRLTTFQLEYPRFIHAEFMTHRVFSRNASSSRAIPVERMLKSVREQPAKPMHWGANQAGMQADKENDQSVKIPDGLLVAYNAFRGMSTLQGELPPVVDRQMAWKFSAWLAAEMSEALSDAGYHKQVANRLTEPFQTMKVVVTASEYANFFALRDHSMAQPEIQDLAATMIAAMNSAPPVHLEWGQWHLPYLTDADQVLTTNGKLMVCTAKCARVSYDRHDGESANHLADFNLHERLVGSDPKHFSPAEHPAVAIRGQFANFNGFASYRWQLERSISLSSEGTA